jgi:hypothetical protein
MNLTSDHLLKVPVVRRPEYLIELEQPNPDTTFAHCSILVPWTGRVRRWLAEDFELLLRLHGGPLHCLVKPDDTKLQRFLRLFGFERALTLTDLTSGRTDLIFRTAPHGLDFQTIPNQNDVDLDALGSPG